jgi:hypothetical protein
MGRCEIKRNGEVAFLEYNLAGNILELNHTEVPVFGVRVRCAEAVNSLPLGSLARDADCGMPPCSRTLQLLERSAADHPINLILNVFCLSVSMTEIWMSNLPRAEQNRN